MSINAKRGLIFGIIILLSCGSFFIYRIPNLFSYSITTLENLRNYATVLSASIASVVGILGIFVGFIYYIEKKNYDEAKIEKEKTHNLLIYLSNEIDLCDTIIEKLYHKQVNTPEIKGLLDEISKRSELISLFIEKNDKSLQLNTDEYSLTIQWLSYIGTSSISRIRTKTEITQAIIGERSIYVEKYKKVKIALMNK